MRLAALVTRSGEAYTWGSGAGGRLGLGHAVDACAPQRVHTLWGLRINSITAGGVYKSSRSIQPHRQCPRIAVLRRLLAHLDMHGSRCAATDCKLSVMQQLRAKGGRGHPIGLAHT